ncbi:hypothetical protein VPH35_072979 [Triticum aestivum]
MADAEAARGEHLVQSGSSGASGARGTCGAHWYGRAHRARQVRLGCPGRRGTLGVCRRRRRSSACVAGVVMEHSATGVGASGRVRGLGQGYDDDNDGSYTISDDGELVARHNNGRGGVR